MRNKSTLTPSQTAAVLNVSSSTLRRWSACFGKHLSEGARGANGRHRTYTPDDIATLKRAGELVDAGHSPDEVAARLGLADEVQQTAALATLPTVAGEIQTLRGLVMQLAGEIVELKQANADQAITIAQQAAALADLRAADVTLRAEVGQAFARQAKRAKMQAAELAEIRAQIAEQQARRHWWQRFTRK